MPIKKGGKSIVLNAEILSSVEKRKESEGFMGSLPSYIETIVGLYAKGLLVEKERYDLVMDRFEKRLETIDGKLNSLGEEQLGLAKSLRGGKGPVDLRGHSGSGSEQTPQAKVNPHKG